MKNKLKNNNLVVNTLVSYKKQSNFIKKLINQELTAIKFNEWLKF